MKPLAVCPTVIIALAAVLATTAPAVQAAVLTPLDRASFQAALAGSQVGRQTFDGLPSGSVLLSDGDVTYRSSNGDPLVTDAFLTSTEPNGLGQTAFGFFAATDTLLLTFSQAITAFAIDFNTFSTDDASYSALLNTGDLAFSRF